MDICCEDILFPYGEQIEEILLNKKDFYKSFRIPKRTGYRMISAPKEPLKFIQNIILHEILNTKRYLISSAAYAFMPNKSAAECAGLHVGKAKITCVDIHDFFGSIKERHVRDSLKYALRLTDSETSVVTELCTLHGAVPQGACTSPMLSNFVCRMLDRRFMRFCGENGITYTRYADDLIFSGDFDEQRLLGYAKWALDEYYGFKINYAKVRTMKRNQRQIVLGLLVNDRCRLTKQKRSELRRILYQIEKYGFGGYSDEYIRQLLGYTSYALGVEPEDDTVKRLRCILYSEQNPKNIDIKF